jgi:hypothetical protein
MKTFIKNNIVIIILLILIHNQSIAQTNVPFKPRFEKSVKGDMTIIANNIVNRVDYNNGPNIPYYNLSNYSQSNQDLLMQYIDIDEDENTFSSSSAELYLDKPENKKIVYAGLYWAATYKYNEGIQKKADKFIASDPTRDSFSTVLLKLPNQDKYTSVSGQIIFDGIHDNQFKDIAPYAVYADITSQVQALSNPLGVYTIANIKATQGVISGGVSAGWTILMVYEDATMSEKRISSFDGFSGVSGLTKNTTDIVFTGFTTPTTGNVNAKIACAAIEGDATFIGDQLLFSANSSNKFTALSTAIRKENNFFTSCITTDEKHFLNRFPDSKNTLGYDTCLFSIPNKNNSLIGNNVNQATVRVSSNGDNYFMFFAALNIEINPIIKQKQLVTNTNKLTTSSNINIKYTPVNNDFLVNDYKTTSAKNLNDRKSETIEIKTMRSSNQPKGYYLIANVLKSDEETRVYVAVLKSKKFDAQYFINPLNNLRYVYLKKSDDRNEIIDQYVSKLNNTYKENLWIFSINNDNSLITSED